MKRRKNITIIIIVIILISTLIYSIFNIIKWQTDSNKTTKQIQKVQEITPITETNNNTNTEIINQQEELPKSNPYWDYINMSIMNVDFTNLKKINTDIQGWIKLNGTNINYPFVQTNNNKYYLNHNIDKSYNTAGWLFLDYRNDKTNNKNTIIYAHGRTDKTMFGSLKDVLSNNWLKDTNNYVIKISTENENTLWQIFSTYHIPTTNDYLQTTFSSDDEFKQFLDKILNRSMHNFNTKLNTNDSILTLSTCYNNSEKMVVHAKLIKKESK